MIDEGQINNWFTYHSPSKDQTVKYEAIRAHAREFAHVINNLVPDGPDKTVALRTLREAVMWANAAIATDQTPDPATAPAPIRKAADVLTGSLSPYQTTVGAGSRVAAARHQRADSLDDVVAGFVAQKTGA